MNAVTFINCYYRIDTARYWMLTEAARNHKEGNLSKTDLCRIANIALDSSKRFSAVFIGEIHKTPDIFISTKTQKIGKVRGPGDFKSFFRNGYMEYVAWRDSTSDVQFTFAITI